MLKKSAHQLALKSIKRQAHKLAREKLITKGEALEIIAHNNSFDNWQAFRTHLLENGNNSSEKIYYHEYDPELHDLHQVRGLIREVDDTLRIQFRVSYISIFSYNFSTVAEMRDYFDETIKNILSTSKSHMLYFLLINYDANKQHPVDSIDGFFDAILQRFLKITQIELFPSVRPLTIYESHSIINGKNAELSLMMDQFK